MNDIDIKINITYLFILRLFYFYVTDFNIFQNYKIIKISALKIVLLLPNLVSKK